MTERRIRWEDAYDSAWMDVVDACAEGDDWSHERMPSEWCVALACLGWCLRDAGYAAACERRGYAMGRADALR